MEVGWSWSAVHPVLCVAVLVVGHQVLTYGIMYLWADVRSRELVVLLQQFVACMGVYLLSSDLVGLLGCWEMIGTISYLLVSFYWHRPTAVRSATWGMMYNKFADAFLLVALPLAFGAFGSLAFVCCTRSFSHRGEFSCCSRS